MFEEDDSSAKNNNKNHNLKFVDSALVKPFTCFKTNLNLFSYSDRASSDSHTVEKSVDDLTIIFNFKARFIIPITEY